MVEEVLKEIKDDPNDAAAAAEANAKAEVKHQRKSKKSQDDELDGFGPKMKLDRDYRPLGKFWLETDDSMHESTDAFESNKVKAGNIIRVPIEEARRLNKLEIATRCDDF